MRATTPFADSFIVRKENINSLPLMTDSSNKELIKSSRFIRRLLWWLASPKITFYPFPTY